MGRKESIERATSDYEKMDRDIERARFWVQNRLLGHAEAGLYEDLERDNRYLQEARSVCGDDLNLLFAWVCNRESRAFKGPAVFGSEPDSGRDLSGRGRSEGQIRYQIGALHYAFDLPQDLREHGTEQLQTLAG